MFWAAEGVFLLGFACGMVAGVIVIMLADDRWGRGGK